MRLLGILGALALFSFPASAQSSTIVSSGFSSPFAVSSYSMPNGGTGYYQYHDYIYPSANASTDFALLSGGTGLLTDGIAATQSWDIGMQGAPGEEQGQFVGWYLEPTINFFFTSAIEIAHMRVNFDLSYRGAVGAPGPVTVNGVTYAVSIPGGSDPFWADFDLTGSAATNVESVRFTRGAPWLMISEVEFVTATPEPGSLVLLATGLLAVLGGVRMRRQRSPVT
ncbi:hypothetical protein BH11GEM2_BH11GEM2_25980 [soil metagenome]